MGSTGRVVGLVGSARRGHSPSSRAIRRLRAVARRGLPAAHVPPAALYRFASGIWAVLIAPSRGSTGRVVGLVGSASGRSHRRQRHGLLVLVLGLILLCSSLPFFPLLFLRPRTAPDEIEFDLVVRVADRWNRYH